MIEVDEYQHTGIILWLRLRNIPHPRDVLSAKVTVHLWATAVAAGAGMRLRPLTEILPKALRPVDNVPLVDLALRRAGPVVAELAVNVHHGRELMRLDPLAGLRDDEAT